MKSLLLILLATQCLAATTPRVRNKHVMKRFEPFSWSKSPVIAGKRQRVPPVNDAASSIESVDGSISEVAETSAPSLSLSSDFASSILEAEPSLSASADFPPVAPTVTTSLSAGGVATPAIKPGPGFPLYIFPSSIIQVPVATLCPLNNYTNGSLPSDTTALPLITIPLNMTATSQTPETATATTLTDNNLSPTSPALLDDERLTNTGSDIARVILGNDTCQTIYAPTTTAICSTTLKLAGLPFVPITKCNQYVTFSTALPTTCPRTSYIPLDPAGTPSGTPQTDLATMTLAPRSTPSRNSVHDTLYYVAHWWDLISNDVPAYVRVEDCPENSIGDACAAHTESWEVSSSTTYKTDVKSVTYYGPVIFTSGTYSLTTSVSISTLVTTTKTVVMPTIVRHLLTASSDGVATSAIDLGGDEESTQTVPATVPTTLTWSLEAVGDGTTTVTSKITVTSTLGLETRTQV